MDRNINPLAAGLVILIGVVVFGTWFWSSGEAKKYGGPSGLSINPAGHLFIQIQNQLIEHGPGGRFIARHDLVDLNVEFLLGGTAFFSNGDILLRRGADSRSLIDNIRAFQRRTNDQPIESNVADTGLYRCNLTTDRCELFGTQPIDFRSAFSVYIDPETDDVYIADSSRHLVRKYSSTGAEVADPVPGFKFPNQLMLHQQQLYVVDTNHHRISVIDKDSANFGSEYFDKNVVPAEARTNKQRWPSHFARVGDDWWVNNMQSGMNYGGIYVFDNDWHFKHEVALPGKADPISLLAFNDEVLISDWYGDRVHRVSTSGESLGDFASAGLAEVLAESVVERNRFMLIAWLAVAFGVVLVVAIVIKGTDWTRKVTQAESDPQPQHEEGPIVLEPDPDNVANVRKNMRMLRWVLIPLAVIVPALIVISDDTQARVQLILGAIGFAAMYFVIAWMARVQTTSSIRFDANSVTLGDHGGREVHNAPSKVFFTENIVTSGDIAIFLKQGQLPVYDHDFALDILAQRLPSSQRISHWAMQKKLIAMRHPFGLMGLAVLAVILIIALFLLLHT